MVGEDISLILSVIATTLAVASFCGALWRIWRDRPRLNFYVAKSIIRDESEDIEFKMLQIKATNVGFRPIILTGFFAIGEKSSFSMGVYDEPILRRGEKIRCFPSILELGKTLIIHPMTIESFEKNFLDPKDEKVFFDPYKYFIIRDSFNHFHHMNIKDIRWNLHMEKQRVPMKWWQKVSEFYQRKSLFYRARRSFLKRD